MSADTLDFALWLQIQPQYAWHDDATITGNAAALRALGAVLTATADSDAGALQVFASDGEGYDLIVRRIERPDDFPRAYYSIETEWETQKGRMVALLTEVAELKHAKKSLTEENARLAQALEEARKDAERYRIAREVGDWTQNMTRAKTPAEFDAACDRKER